jgi:hypothetical protein
MPPSFQQSKASQNAEGKLRLLDELDFPPFKFERGGRKFLLLGRKKSGSSPGHLVKKQGGGGLEHV